MGIGLVIRKHRFLLWLMVRDEPLNRLSVETHWLQAPITDLLRLYDRRLAVDLRVLVRFHGWILDKL